MRLFVVGATGQTGGELLKQALEDGHTVTAFVRNPDKITTKHDNLKVVKGNVFKADDIASGLSGHDAVISCLGFPRQSRTVTGYTESHKALVTAMRTCNVTRLITITSWFTDTNSAKDQGIIIKWGVVPFLKTILDGMFEMENYLKESCKDINYTVVRPPHLGTGPKTGKEIHTSESYYVTTDSRVYVASAAKKTNRSDVAAFMLSCLSTNTYDRKMVAITTAPVKR